MVVTSKILKRKDASSVIVAVVVAMIIVNLLPVLTGSLANTLSGADSGQSSTASYPGADWQTHYLQPVIWAILQLVFLEVFLWLYTSIVAGMNKK